MADPIYETNEGIFSAFLDNTNLSMPNYETVDSTTLDSYIPQEFQSKIEAIVKEVCNDENIKKLNKKKVESLDFSFLNIKNDDDIGKFVEKWNIEYLDVTRMFKELTKNLVKDEEVEKKHITNYNVFKTNICKNLNFFKKEITKNYGIEEFNAIKKNIEKFKSKPLKDKKVNMIVYRVKKPDPKTSFKGLSARVKSKERIAIKGAKLWTNLLYHYLCSKPYNKPFRLTYRQVLITDMLGSNESNVTLDEKHYLNIFDKKKIALRVVALNKERTYKLDGRDQIQIKAMNKNGKIIEFIINTPMGILLHEFGSKAAHDIYEKEIVKRYERGEVHIFDKKENRKEWEEFPRYKFLLSNMFKQTRKKLEKLLDECQFPGIDNLIFQYEKTKPKSRFKFIDDCFKDIDKKFSLIVGKEFPDKKSIKKEFKKNISKENLNHLFILYMNELKNKLREYPSQEEKIKSYKESITNVKRLIPKIIPDMLNQIRVILFLSDEYYGKNNTPIKLKDEFYNLAGEITYLDQASFSLFEIKTDKFYNIILDGKKKSKTIKNKRNEYSLKLIPFYKELKEKPISDILLRYHQIITQEYEKTLLKLKIKCKT